VEAVFNTLLEDEDLLKLLFSLLDQQPPLSCKAAGYFGRVVGQLLLRKTNEMMQHLSHNDEILEKLIHHVDTTSIADIIKRLVGADDHSSMIFSPMHTQWLADTPLINMLLDRLGPEYTPNVQVGMAGVGAVGALPCLACCTKQVVPCTQCAAVLTILLQCATVTWSTG
jgi:serine/threonine-protein phosphatase 6 regulatory subunit 3